MAYASRSDIVRYGAALLSVAATLLLERGLSSYLKSTELRLLLLLLPVMISAWLGGRGAGLVATVLSAAGTIYIFEPSPGLWGLFTNRDVALFVFIAEGVFISLLAGMLHQSERRNAAIHRGATDGVITANQQGKVVDLSSAAEQLFGYRRQAVLGKHLFELLVPRGSCEARPEDLWREVRSNSGGMLGNRIEMTALHADGTTFPVDMSLTLLPQNDGPPFFAGFVRDIRPRKQLEQQLNRQTQITRLLQQANALLSTTRSFENVMQNCLEMVCGITAWPVGRIYLPDERQQELLSSKVVHYENQETRTIKDSRRFRRGEGLPGRIWETSEPEWEVRPSDSESSTGMTHPADPPIRGTFGFPVKVHQDVVAVMEFMTTDESPPSEEVLSLLSSVGEQLGQVIERRRREEQLRRARDDAEAANRAKSEFLANVSHEVRTPMNAVLGVLQIVLGEDLPPAIRDHLTTAADSARTLMALLNDLLDFSRMEAGRFELDAAPFNLREGINASLKTLAFKAQEKNLQLICRVEPDVPDQLIGDVRRLRQVLLNLVGNAIKFTQQGEVAVSVGLWKADESVPAAGAALRLNGETKSAANVCLHVTVADTGIGIHPDDQDRIFEPFTQVDSSSTRRHTGTGLGLTICSELVRRMGGRMWVESQLGKGSKFHCTVCFVAQATQKTTVGLREHVPFSSFNSPTTRPLRVLLAEDTPANQKVVSAILSKRGHLVEIAHDGRETVDKVRSGEFDVVLMDVQMPNLDGYQATRMIRRFSEERQARIPIVAMTAHAMSGDREQCLAAGMDDYVPKPIDAMELIHTIERVAEESPQGS